MYIMPKGRY